MGIEDSAIHGHHAGPPAPAAGAAETRCVIGEYCCKHHFIHGAEAEELRERIEKLVKGTPGRIGALRDDICRLLDEVDARDSLAFVETPEGLIEAPPGAALREATPAPDHDQIEAMVGDGWMLRLHRSKGYGPADPRRVADAIGAASKILSGAAPLSREALEAVIAKWQMFETNAIQLQDAAIRRGDGVDANGQFARRATFRLCASDLAALLPPQEPTPTIQKSQGAAAPPLSREVLTPYALCREHQPDRWEGVRCGNYSPPWFTGHWRDWHRGHGCRLDDGKPRRANAAAEIAGQQARSAPEVSREAPVTRVEVIGDRGRVWGRWHLDEVTLSYQDGGRTLKIFVRGDTKPSQKQVRG